MDIREQATILSARLGLDAGALNELLEREITLELECQKLASQKGLLKTEHILRETCKEGAINGSNEAKRKLQTILFLHDLGALDESYGLLDTELESKEEALKRAKMELKQAANSFRATRDQTLLVAAMLTALTS